MKHELPPVVKLAERMLAEVELTVCKFTRYHKYTVGTELRRRAWNVAEVAQRAWRDRDNRGQWTSALVWAVDDLKLGLQLAKQINAFPSFPKFEELARLAADLGRQVGGWHRQLHPNGQNAVRPQAPLQRPSTLSTQATCQQVNT